MKNIKAYVFFYAITSIPAYLLIYLGLKGIGIINYSYSYYTQPGIMNFTPTPQFALYFILIGSGIILGIVLHLFKTLSKQKFEELEEFLKLRSGLHTHHCEISSFGTYFGLGLVGILLVMYFIIQIVIVNNLIVLFGISLVSGIGAVIYYRYDNKKPPF